MTNDTASYLSAISKPNTNVTSLGGTAVVPDSLVDEVSQLVSGSVSAHDPYQINDINLDIFVGDNFSLPETVKALQYDSTVTDLPVTWDKTQLDTKAKGVYSFKGKVERYNKDVLLTVNVKVGQEKSNNTNLYYTSKDGAIIIQSDKNVTVKVGSTVTFVESTGKTCSIYSNVFYKDGPAEICREEYLNVPYITFKETGNVDFIIVGDINKVPSDPRETFSVHVIE